MTKPEKMFDFIGKRKIFFAISLILIAIGLLFNVVFGIEMDIQFKGGTLIKYSYHGSLDREKVEAFVESKTGEKAEVQISENVMDDNNVLNISLMEEMTMDQQASLDEAMKTEYKDYQIKRTSINSLSPTMGRMFFLKCVVAIALASVFLVLYVALRFRKIGGYSAGIMALVALLHDILIAYFAFVVFRIPLNDNFVAVVLSILGYSLNDTIVIYDRIRENRRLMDKTASIGEIVNRSINQSFTRSFNTGMCTFIAIGTVAVLALVYRLDPIVSFAVPMMLGVVSGCYSTVCICGPLWVTYQNYQAKKQGLKKKDKA